MAMHLKRAGSSKGAIGAIFAILLGSGSLFGVVALAYDLGNLYLEQQTLRLAATSAARGVAEKCANFQPQCATQSDATTLTQSILNQNSSDGLSAVHEVCGSSPLNACSALTSRSMDCKAIPGGSKFVRVKAKTQTSTGTVINRVFAGLTDTNPGNVFSARLWNCAQASWSYVNTGGIQTDQIAFNIAMPACSYPGDTSAVVIFRFQDSGGTPNPPRAASCFLANLDAGVNLTNVANGFTAFTASVGACTTPVTINVGQTFAVFTGNVRTYCGGSNTSLQTFLNGKIASGASVRVAMPDSFVSTGGSKWNFNVLGYTDFKFLGYHIENGREGGAIPPGGWAAYPPGAGATKCTGGNTCFYGQYMTQPSFLATKAVVKVVP